MISGNSEEEKHFRSQESSVVLLLSDRKPQTYFKMLQVYTRYLHFHFERKVTYWLASSQELVESPQFHTLGLLQRSSSQNSHSFSALGQLVHWSFLAHWSLQSVRCDLLSGVSHPSNINKIPKKCFQSIHKISFPLPYWNYVQASSWPWGPMQENTIKSTTTATH